MSSVNETAEQRLWQAYERVKFGKTQVISLGSPMSQANVAREAGLVPSALRKSRFPQLVRQIQADVEINNQEETLRRKRNFWRKKIKVDLSTRIKILEAQRDSAQAELISAKRLVLELLQEKDSLQVQLDELRTPVTLIRK